MLRRILGLFDIICSVVLLISTFLPGHVEKIVGGYLIVKGLLFGIILGIGYGGLNFVSIIDAVIGGYLIFGFGNTFFNIMFFVFLVQKGLFSLF